MLKELQERRTEEAMRLAKQKLREIRDKLLREPYSDTNSYTEGVLDFYNALDGELSDEVQT